MSQRAVETALGKLLTDERFRHDFYLEPEAASRAAGLDLSCDELQALTKIPCRALAALCRSLDDRICRLPVPVEQGPRHEATEARATTRRSPASRERTS
jgi:hypothetical protein